MIVIRSRHLIIGLATLALAAVAAIAAAGSAPAAEAAPTGTRSATSHSVGPITLGRTWS